MSTDQESNPEKKQSTGNKAGKLIALLVILALPSVLYLLLSTGKHNITALPYYGERETVTSTSNGETLTDTIYHKIADFSLLNQSGKTVTRKDLEGKIYIADFIFTTCPTICPKMGTNMAHLQDKLKNYPDVMFVSHTVDPDHDSVEVLAQYAQEIHADTSSWMFLTGDRDEIYELGVKSYLLPVGEDVLAPGGFLHSEQFVLVDREGHIRGMFDGTSLKEMNELVDAVKAYKASEIIEQEKQSAREKRRK